MLKPLRVLLPILALVLLLPEARPAAAQCVSLAALGVPYLQDFNTLASAGTSSTVPTGWAFSEAGTNANTTYTAGTGSSGTGDTYSFGGAANSERAFGGLLSGSLNPTIGACFTNDTGVTVSNLTVAYTGEQWRLGTAARTDRLDFEYSLDATSLTTGTWIPVDALDFTTPNTASPTGAKDGNDASFRTAVSSAISPLSIANGATVWIRWLDFNASGADDGLAVDDFSLTPSVLDTAPSVLTTSPPDGATGVGLAASLDVTFSEPVNVAPGWFTISCTLSGAHAAMVSGGPVTFTLDPTVDFVANEICTVTIDNDFVADQDANDPPDTPAADYIWSFDTNPPPLLVVNEIDYDQSGTDAAEFLEIRNNDAVPVDLDPVVVELVNGNGGGAAVYQTIDLPSFLLAPGAYFVVCANNTTTPNCDLDVAPDTNLIQNGAPDAVALRWNGVLIDTLSYEGDTGAPYTETSGSGLADDGVDDFAGIARFPDGGDTGVNNADLSERCITPGAANAAATAPCPPPALLGLAINDVTLAEGNAGTTTFTFTVSLPAPAGPGGVTFDIATQDDTATTADNDYVVNSLTGQTIPAGSSTYAFNVTVNGDTTPEPNETFFVNVTNVTGINVADGQGTGTIQNDDVTLIPIHDIQGPGASSPVVGSSVTTTGIVTGVRSNGFFIQEPDASVDADPATSEGILVFTGGAPPAAAVVGALVQVTGTVTEFVPSQDPLQPPLTELSLPTVVQLSTGNPLPAAIPLSATFPDPAGVHDQLERLEGMRVSVASLTVTGPTLGSISEPNATANSSGVFYGVVTGVPRPFREAGIPAPDPAPSGGGTIPPIPRFDSNPERIRVDSDGLAGGPLLDVGAGAVVTGLVGPLDYSFRTYTILPDPGASIGVAGGPAATAVTAATVQEFTVASYNMQRFFDTVDDPGTGEPVLTPAAFDMRLAKASLAIRNSLQMPDIIGVAEVENLSTLQTLAARISTDAIAAAQPDPEYDAYLVEGNDIGGIDVGFLVKTAPVFGATPRVAVNTVVQELDGTLFVNPDTSTETLNDRPPLRLMAVVNHPSGASFPVTVIANHLRSLGSVNSEDPGSNGWPTDGARVRAKRQAQAEDLADLVQARQVADPAEHIILLGDFNAFEVNDGLGHSMGVIAGTPAPDNETAVPGDGVDLVNPDFDNLFDSPPPAERYSYVFDGNAQNLDHILINAPLDADTLAHRAEHARVNADFPETARNDGTTPVRLSDHDPVVAYFAVAGFTGSADLAVTKVDTPDPVTAGTNLTYTITVTNAGPTSADAVTVSDPLPAGTAFVSLASPGGWTCSTPAVGAGGMVSCSIASLPVGDAVFTLTVAVGSDVPAGMELTNLAAAFSESTPDPNPENEVGVALTTVAASADVSVTKVDTPDPVAAGASLTYTITVTNAGPSNAANVVLSDTLPADTTFQSISSPWACPMLPVIGSPGAINCSISSFAPGSAVFTLTVAVGSGVANGTVLTNTAVVTSSTTDPSPGNESAGAETTVTNSTVISATKTAGGQFTPGGMVTYTVVLTNSSGLSQADNPGDEFTDVLPAQLTLVSAGATSGTAVATLATNTVTWNGSIAGGASVTITIQATVSSGAAPGTPITNQGTVAYDADGNGTNEASAATDDPAAGGASDPTTFLVAGLNIAEIPALNEVGLALLALLLALGGAVLMRRRARS